MKKYLKKVKNRIAETVKFVINLDPLVRSRYVYYAAILAGLLLLAIILAVAFHELMMAALPLLAFIGIFYLFISYHLMCRSNEYVIIYGVCESKDTFTPSLIDRFHTLSDKKKRKFEYRVLVTASNGDASYLYLILSEYNRMREGASYKMMFKKNEDGDYNEKNLICFVQIPQDVQVKGVTADEEAETAGSEEPSNLIFLNQKD